MIKRILPAIGLLFAPVWLPAQTPIPCHQEVESHNNGTHTVSGHNCIESPYGDSLTISGNANVEYLAGQDITLKPGFSASGFDSTGNFRAYIRPNDIEAVVMHPATLDSQIIVPCNTRLELGLTLPDSLMQQVIRFKYDSAGTQLNPFNPDELDITCYVTNTQTGEVQKWFAFFYQPYDRVTTDANPDNWYYAEQPNPYPFRVRITPTANAVYNCRMEVKLHGQPVYTVNDIQFACTASNAGHSFVEVGAGKRYLRLDGNQFFPVGANLAWPECYLTGYCDNDDRVQTYLGHRPLPTAKFYPLYLGQMETMRNEGSNYFRFFLSQWSTDIEYEKLGNYFGADLQHPDTLKRRDRQKLAWEVDSIVMKAEELGLFMQFDMLLNTPLNDAASFHQFNWDWRSHSPLDSEYGYCYQSELGLDSARYFFTDSAAIAWYKKKVRYIVARWGYSPNIAMWELLSEANTSVKINEVQPNGTGGLDYVPGSMANNYEVYADPAFQFELFQWHKELARYVKEDLEDDRHLIAVNYAGNPWGDGLNADLSFKSAYIDVATYNNYTNRVDRDWVTAQAIEPFHDLLPDPSRFINKPVMLGENGLPDGLESCDNNIEFIKDAWISPFTGLAGMALAWHKQYNAGYTWGNLYENIAAFFSAFNLESNGGWVPEWSESANLLVEMNALRSADRSYAIGIVANRSYNYYTGGVDSTKCDTIVPEVSDSIQQTANTANYGDLGEGITLPNMLPSLLPPLYVVLWFHPFDLSLDAVTVDGTTGAGVALDYGQLVPSSGGSMKLFYVFRNDLMALDSNEIALLNETENLFLPDLVAENTNDPVNMVMRALALAYSKQEQETVAATPVFDNADEVNVFPNPTNGMLFVHWKEYSDNVQLSLFTLQGQLVYRNSTPGYHTNIDLSGFDRGTYYLEVRTGNNLWHKKIIKQ